MKQVSSLVERDLKHIWHPCSQMKDFEQYPPMVVNHAKGSYLYTDRGPIIDAISSWWCKSLGHGHPAVVAAIQAQLSRFEHVIGANTTHPILVELAESLTTLSGKQHVFFASDGSSAVEIALKLALQAQSLKGRAERQQVIALEHGYHGETIGALSVSDLGSYKTPFDAWTTPSHILQGVPYVFDESCPLWSDCSAAWPAIQKQLEAYQATTCAIIVEPIIQGAGQMRCYSADFLNRLYQFAKSNDIYLIADEIMTGIGRTGEWFASSLAQIDPDMICLSKGLTSGSLPFSCVLIDHAIYELFYADYSQSRAFLHSHTYSGNALAASAALATLRTIESEGILQQAKALNSLMRRYFSDISRLSGKLGPIRSIGAMVAADLIPHPRLSRVGYRIAEEALTNGALLRPIGDTLYWLPPLTTDEDTIGKLAEITLHSINKAYQFI
jgi:adenosylmethionine-8-amino-7-oxononanoate aminotransferase